MMVAHSRLTRSRLQLRAIAARHGVPYKTASWGKTLIKAVRHVRQLARVDGTRAVLREAA